MKLIIFVNIKNKYQMNHDYNYYNTAIKKETLPLAFVDVDFLDKNIKAIAERAGNKNIRVASKSIRNIWTLKRIFEANKKYQGIMSFTGAEALFLIEQGFDDILLGYPIIDENQIRNICKLTKIGKKIILMTDCISHASLINSIAEEEQVTQPICIDVDMSSDFLGLHFGVYRSSLTSVRDAKTYITQLLNFKNIKLTALMGYEAQIAGVGDTNPANGIKNFAIKFLKKKSIPEYTQRRKEVIEYIKQKCTTLEIVNAGGTGSMEWNKVEDDVTEITVGSGFFSPALFDYYDNFKHLPAAGFALPIVRQPKDRMFTCLGGGYIASGSVGIDKQPKPYLPDGVQITENEGCGEVQTPFVYNGKQSLKIGDAIFFRHSKAGELCERFNELYLIKEGSVVEKIPTYRGMGKCFL